MIIRLGMAPRAAGLSHEEFQEHWRTQHADVVSHLPGLRRYQQFHAVLDGGVPLRPDPGFDACSALRFDTVEEMDGAFAEGSRLDEVKADEARFVDKSRFLTVIGQWRADAAEDLGESGTVYVLTLLAAAAEETGNDLAARLVGVGNPTSGGSLVADHDAHDGRFPVAADAVRIAGYADVAAALVGAAAVREKAGAAAVIGEHIARIVDVPLAGPMAEPRGDRKVREA